MANTKPVVQSAPRVVKPATGTRVAQPKTSAGPKPRPNTPENKKSS